MKKKIKIKSLKKLPKKWDKEGYLYASALLEDVQSNFQIFGDNLSFVRDKQEGLSIEVASIKEEITGIKISQDFMKSDIREMKSDITEIKGKQNSMELDIKKILNEIKFIKNDIEYLKDKLMRKADVELLQNLEERVHTIETILHTSK